MNKNIAPRKTKAHGPTEEVEPVKVPVPLQLKLSDAELDEFIAAAGSLRQFAISIRGQGVFLDSVTSIWAQAEKERRRRTRERGA